MRCSAAMLIAFLPCMTLSMAADAGRAGCLQDFYDLGDAPECVPAYPSGVLGRFPTLPQGCGSGTREIAPGCPPRSSAPGAPGYVVHVNNYDAWQLWLGCYGSSFGSMQGADDDVLPRPKPDCTETAFGMTFDQDECFDDGRDAGLLSPPVFLINKTATVQFSLVRCVASQVYLNVLIDMNADGDWNDSFTSPIDSSKCAFEWAVKNYEIPYASSLCATYTSPEFLMGPHVGPGWMRITVSTNPAADSFPWSGQSANSDMFLGGETEDYPVMIDLPVPAGRATWGALKLLYH